jgi:hypothetical protein
MAVSKGLAERCQRCIEHAGLIGFQGALDAIRLVFAKSY